MKEQEVLEQDVRNQLIQEYGEDNVWNTEEATEAFSFESFLAPYVVVIRKSDNKKGSMVFTDRPRFYFNFSVHGE